MTRNLKTLGLALGVVFAIGAAAAAAASAQQGFLTSDGPVTLTASETGEKTNAWTMFGLSVECPGFTYTGHKYNETPHKFISSGATTVTITPHHAEKNCKSGGVFPTTVDMNGCDFVLRLGETTPVGNKEGTYGVTTDIVCPPGKTITTTLFTSATKHAEGKPFCILDIQSQLGIKGAHATDTGNGFVDITGAFEGIHILRTNVEDPILCPNNSTTKEAKFDIDITVSGQSEIGKPTEISISE